MVIVLGGVVSATAAALPVGAAAASAMSQGLVHTTAGLAGLPAATSFGAMISALGEGALVGLGALGGGGSTGIALATAAGPVGAAVVGCSKNDKCNDDGGYTWDCWKPVVRETSTSPSHGMPLRSLAAHPNVQSMSIEHGELLVGNVFGERFRLIPVNVEGTLAFHASILSL